MSEDLKLLPCPFCGGTAKIMIGNGELWASCCRCRASTRGYTPHFDIDPIPIENLNADEISELRNLAFKKCEQLIIKAWNSRK